MNSIIIPCAACSKKNKIPADKQHLKPKCGHCGVTIILNNQAVPVELDDRNFHDFIQKASLPVMVDFFSPTCGPCQMMMPIVQTMAERHVNKFIVAKIDTGRNPHTASFFNIRGVPSFFFFKKGKLIDKIDGAVPEVTLEKMLLSMQ